MQRRMWTLFVLLPTCTLVGNGDLDERLQAVLDHGIERYDIHGVSAAVIFPDGTIWNGVSGISHGDTAIAPDMVFGIGSITKNVVAALTLKLVEEGVVALDDPLSKWLPPYPHIDDRITARQLLNHTSGIYNFWDNQEIWDDLMSEPSRVFTPEEVLGYIQAPTFLPGDGWAYSNTNYLLVAMIMEKATGSTLPNLIRERLFEPNSLSPVYLCQEDNTPPNQAHIYGDDNGFGIGDVDNTFMPRAAHESITVGSSGVFTNSKTLARWGHKLFKGDILEADSLQAMTEMVSFPPVANMRAYGLGVQEYQRQFSHGQLAIGHGGGNIGTSSYLVHFPDHDVTIVVMINAFPNRGLGSITRKLSRLVLRDMGVIGPLPYIDPALVKVPALFFSISLSIFIAIQVWNRKRHAYW